MRKATLVIAAVSIGCLWWSSRKLAGLSSLSNPEPEDPKLGRRSLASQLDRIGR